MNVTRTCALLLLLGVLLGSRVPLAESRDAERAQDRLPFQLGGGVFPDLVARAGPLGGTIVLEFTAPSPQAVRYEVWMRTRHFRPDDFVDGRQVPRAFPAKEPGSRERLVFSLETRWNQGVIGGTRQVAIRTVRGGTPGPVSVRTVSVKPPAPTPPASAIKISRPGHLDRPGGTYLLTADVTAPGTAFVIAARGITLDLGGHTVTYGTGARKAHGVAARGQHGRGTITVRNGRLVQGAGDGAASHAIDIDGGHNLRLTHLDLDVHGRDAGGIALYGKPTGRVLIDHNTIHCRTQVVGDRHYPGVTALFVDQTVPIEIAHNRIIGGPQWGIRVAGKGAQTECLIHHNVVTDSKALVANGYMIGVHRPHVDVFDNLLVGESRGIHVDGVDGDGHNVRIHDNVVHAQDQPNPEYDKHWSHGLKLEDSHAALVYHNVVRALADERHSTSHALDMDAGSDAALLIYGNRFEGLSRVPGKPGKALVWTGSQRATAKGVTLRHNVFVASDILVQRSWHSNRGILFFENAWLADPVRKGSDPVVFERWDNRDGQASRGHGFVDPFAPEGTGTSSEWARPGPYDSLRAATLTLSVVGKDAQPAAAAHVECFDREGTRVSTGMTDTDGRVRLVTGLVRVQNGARRDKRGPFRLRVRENGSDRPSEHEIDLEGPAAYRINVVSGSATRIDGPPGVPQGLRVEVLAPTRALLRFSPSTAPAGVARYHIEVDGDLWTLTDPPAAILFGLTPGKQHQARVRCVDANGRLSAWSTAIPFGLPPDDRGP